MEMGTTVVLASAHPMMRDGLKLVLQETGRMKVVGETDCVEEAVRLARRLNPDILVVDVGMLQGSGLQAIRRLRAPEPGTNVLVLTGTEHRESLDPIIEAGVRGCIGKNRTTAELVIAVDLVAAGRIRVPRRASRLVQVRVLNNGSGLEARLARLNEKERKVLALTARGHTAQEIGIRIHLATKSVDNYRSAIRRKLGITTRAEFVSTALETGLFHVDLPPSA